jgi:hypothetical protein
MNTLKRNLSMVELLVVMTVLAVLAGLIFVGVSRGLDSARAAQCLSNMSQTGKAWLQCVQDSPMESKTGSRGFSLPKVQEPDGTTWVETLEKYSGDVGIFCCPLQANTGDDAYGCAMNPLVGARWLYGPNMFGYGYLLTAGENRPRPLGLIQRPSQTVVICESGYVSDDTLSLSPEQWREDGSQPWQPYVAFNLTDTTSQEALNLGAINHGYDWGNTVPGVALGGITWDGHYRALGRHSSACSASMADGSVKKLKIGELVLPQFASQECIFDNQRK